MAATGLVGRGAEQRALREILDGAASGRGSVAALIGEAGIGKTALATTTAVLAADLGFAVLRGHCDQAGGAPPYWPWIEVLRGLRHWVSAEQVETRLGSRRHALAHLAPDLAGEPSEAVNIESDEARFLLFDAVMDALILGSEQAPLLVVIEDLHVSDVPSLLLLEFVAKRASGHRLMVLVTYRDIEARLNPLIEETLGVIAASGHRFPLAGLDASEVATLTGATAEAASSVRDACQGNPLMALEMVALSSDQTGSRLPPSARTIFGRRLKTLDPDVQDAIAWAAVIGFEFEVSLLGELTGMPADRVMQAVGAAMRAGVLAEAGFPSSAARFRHALIRDAIYESLDPSERASRHGVIATNLRSHRDPSPTLAAALAHHALQAVPTAGWRPAVDAARAAASKAMTAVAFEDATRLLQGALAVIPPGEDHARLEVLLELGPAAALSREGSVPAKAVFAEAETIARRTGNIEALAHAALGGGEVPMQAFGLTGVPDQRQIALLEEVLEQLPASAELLRARVASRLAAQLWWAPGTDDRRDHLTKQAIDIARRLDDQRLLSRALLIRHTTVSLPPAEASAVADEGILAFHRCGDLASRSEAERLRLEEALAQGDMAVVRAASQAASVMTDQSPVAADGLRARLFAFAPVLVEGRLDEAERMLDELIGFGERTGLGAQMPVLVATIRTMIIRRRFRLEELRGLAELMQVLADDHPGMAPWLPATGITYCWLGDPRGEELVRRSLEDLDALPRDTMWPSTLMVLAEGCVTIEARDFAAPLHEALLPFEGRAALIATVDVYGPVDRALGALEGLMGRWDDAERHLESAVRLDRQMGARPALVQTWLEYARMLQRRAAPGDTARADQLVHQALREGEALGMTDLPTVAENLGLRPSTEPVIPQPSNPGVAVMRREGDVWSVSRGVRPFSLRDSKGMQQLARLVVAAGEIHCLELVGGGGTEREQATAVASSGSAGPALDERAKGEYRRRVEELQAEIDDAEDCADIGRASKAREELGFLLDELTGAVGLGGRDRPAASNAERARVAVTKTIKSAIDRISEHDPELGEHLRSAVSTGVFCSYRPDPTASLRVQVE